MNRGFSIKRISGDIIHYDENGNRVGASLPRLLGGYTDYDKSGNIIGTTETSLYDSRNKHYDNNGIMLLSI